MLVIGGIAAVILVIAAFVGTTVVLRVLAPSSGSPPSSGLPPGSGESPAAAESSPDEPAAVDASSFSWASAQFLPPPPGQPMPNAYALQGGTLGDPARPLDVVVQFAITEAPADIGRVPPIGEPRNGAVVYVADDGRVSQIRRATLSDPASDELILELEAVVWTLTVTPDGSHAYALLVERGQAGDSGVLRVALDGSGEADRVMDPIHGAARDGGLRLAAIAGFRAALMVSPDERFLLRRVCPAGQPCAVDVLEVESGEVLPLPDREVLGVAGELILATTCDNMGGCHVMVTHLATGEERVVGQLSGQAVLATVDGRPVVVHDSPDARANPTTLHATDPVSGDTVELLRGAARGFVELHSNLWVTTKVTGPDGWVVATLWDARGRGQGVAVDLSDGTTLLLPIAPSAASLMGPGG
jgi:hypothetical protein